MILFKFMSELAKVGEGERENTPNMVSARMVAHVLYMHLQEMAFMSGFPGKTHSAAYTYELASNYD